MSKEYYQEKELNGKKLRCTLDFSGYNARTFQSDFKEYIEYQNMTGQRAAEDNDLKLFPKKINNYIKNYIKEMSYDYFKEAATKYFFLCILEMFKQNPALMICECDTFEIRINIKRIPDRSFYFEYEDKDSDDGLAIYNGAGIWFLETIVAPMYYMRRIDYSIIARYFAHEITHHHDKLRGFFEISNKYIKQIRKITKERKLFTINYIYTSMENLRAEGYADFNARINSPSQDINMDGIKVYNANLEKLCMYKSNYRAGLFYDKEIGFENLTPSSEYSNGRYMCLTIAMYVALLRKKPFQIIANNNTISSRDIDNNNYNLNDIISNNKIINIADINKEVLKEALSIVGTTNNDKFIKLYEQACDLLKIKDNNRVMTLRRYGQLIEKIKSQRKNS